MADDIISERAESPPKSLSSTQSANTKLERCICISPLKNPHIRDNIKTFKATFQKPSQIYRFLRQTWDTNPLFLHRTLSYIRDYRKYRAKATTISTSPTKTIVEQKVKSNGRGVSNARDKPTLCDTGYHVAMDKKLYFNWICNDPDRTSQKTRSFSYECPWCEKEYYGLEPLTYHLKTCHHRFFFCVKEEENQIIIEMTLNTSYDGSYCGFKYPGHDLKRDFRFTPDSPERRQPGTHVIHFRPKKKRNVRTTSASIMSFFPVRMRADCTDRSYPYPDNDEADLDVCYSGRLYYHTSTCLPIKPNEVDLDSEADTDPEWLCERTQLMIDEFTDVNEGEKEVLKLWNLHIMKNYKYKSDNMMRQACLDFVEMQGPTILDKNISKNFTLHLANLYDFGLISSGDILECIRMLNKLRTPAHNNSTNTSTTTTTRTTGRIKSDRNSNEHCQHCSPAKRALLNSHYNQI